MRHEPTGSRPPVQQPRGTRCPACQQAKPLRDVAAAPAGRASSCRDCRRAAAVRLLIAAHPEEWAGLLGLVRGRRRLATAPLEEVATVGEWFVRRVGPLWWDAPAARAASLASSAALPVRARSHRGPGARPLRWTLRGTPRWTLRMRGAYPVPAGQRHHRW